MLKYLLLLLLWLAEEVGDELFALALALLVLFVAGL